MPTGSTIKVTFIGLGVMGRPMAGHLLAAGNELSVANRSGSAVEELARLGARPARNPPEAAAGSDVVITMLPDSAAVSAVLDGPGGVLGAMRPGTVAIDMSTIDPGVAVGLATRGDEQGVAVLDAPVSGGDVGAREGTLSIMVGGSAEALERVHPLLATMGTTITRLGGPGSGQLAKAANQVLVALTIEAVAEALALGRAGGLDPAGLLEVFAGGLADNKVIHQKRQRLLSGQFEPGFRATLQHKDLGIALRAARERGVVMPVAPTVARLYQLLLAEGRGGEDHSALASTIERLSTGGAP